MKIHIVLKLIIQVVTRFWSFVKNLKIDNTGVAPLTSDPIEKSLNSKQTISKCLYTEQ